MSTPLQRAAAYAGRNGFLEDYAKITDLRKNRKLESLRFEATLARRLSGKEYYEAWKNYVLGPPPVAEAAPIETPIERKRALQKELFSIRTKGPAPNDKERAKMDKVLARIAELETHDDIAYE